MYLRVVVVLVLLLLLLLLHLLLLVRLHVSPLDVCLGTSSGCQVTLSDLVDRFSPLSPSSLHRPARLTEFMKLFALIKF